MTQAETERFHSCQSCAPRAFVVSYTSDSGTKADVVGGPSRAIGGRRLNNQIPLALEHHDHVVRRSRLDRLDLRQRLQELDLRGIAGMSYWIAKAGSIVRVGENCRVVIRFLNGRNDTGNERYALRRDIIHDLLQGCVDASFHADQASWQIGEPRFHWPIRPIQSLWRGSQTRG